MFHCGTLRDILRSITILPVGIHYHDKGYCSIPLLPVSSSGRRTEIQSYGRFFFYLDTVRQGAKIAADGVHIKIH